jgi:putative membrane protein
MDTKDIFKPILAKNDKAAYWVIGVFSVVIFLAITALARVKVDIDLGFDPHLFAKFNAGINFTVAVLLPAGIYFAKNKKYVLHKRVMMLAILLSSLFLISYVLHHLLTSSTAYPKDAGSIKYFYYFILITHIFLAGIILPFILITAYRALTAEFPVHKKIARITFPIWWYVSITGVLVYEMISPYY